MNSYEDNDLIDIRRYIRTVKQSKLVYTLSAILFFGLALFYCVYKMPQYKSSAAILIEDSTGGQSGFSGSGGLTSIMKTFSVGGFASSSVDNEILVLSSHQTLSDVVRRLNLNITYVESDGISRNMLDEDSPITIITSPEFNDNFKKGLKIRVDLNGNNANIKLSTGPLGIKTIATYENVTLPYEIPTEYGKLYIIKSPNDTASASPRTIKVSIASVDAVVKMLSTQLTIDCANKLADAITIELKYPNKNICEKILNTIMAVYNESRHNRRAQTCSDEAEFLENRIQTLLPDIIETDKSIAEYKLSNNLVDIESESKLLVESTVGSQQNIAKTQFEISYFEEVLKKLKSNDNSLIPTVEGLGNPMIAEYNKTVMTRTRYSKSMTDDNSRLAEIDNQLSILRKALTSNVEAQLDTMRISMNASKKLSSAANSRLMQLPVHEREMLSLYRDRELKNTMYLYLVQKRESALLNAASTDTLGFVYEPAYTEIKTDKTKAIVFCIICALLALILPTLYVIFKTHRNNRISSPIDVTFQNAEAHTVAYTGNDTEICALRNLIVKNSDSTTLLVANLADPKAEIDITTLLMAAMRDIDTRVTSIGASDNRYNHNDYLLSQKFNSEIKSLSITNDFVIASIPDVKNIALLYDMIKQQNAQVLFIIPTPNVVSRKYLKGIIAGNIESFNICLYNTK